jgi:hypothetical protein
MGKFFLFRFFTKTKRKSTKELPNIIFLWPIEIDAVKAAYEAAELKNRLMG